MGKDCDTEDRGETDTLDWAKFRAQIQREFTIYSFGNVGEG
jgi:hypothetical protein